MVSVEFRLDHPIFRETLRQVPAVELEWLRNVPAEDGRVLLFWATIDDVDAFRAAVAADSTIETLYGVTAVGDRYLCQVELTESGRGTDLYPILLESGSVVGEATVTVDGWDCHFEFADETALSRFFETAREADIDYDIGRVYEPESSDAGGIGLTDAQREALLTALELGYFEVPRKHGLEAVGEELNVSGSAVSERIRRGIRSLVTTVVAPDGRSDGGR